MNDPTKSQVDDVFINYEEALGRVRTMTVHPDEFSAAEHAAVAGDIAAADEELTKVDFVTSEQLAPFVTESGIALRRHEKAIHPEYDETYGTLDQILSRMEGDSERRTMMLVQRCARCSQIHPSPRDVLLCLRSERRSTGWRPFRPIPTHFRPDELAFVYLIAHSSKGALKVGVSSDSRGGGAHQLERVSDHEELGWHEVQIWFFPNGYDALDCEELVLDRWKNLYSSPQAVSRQEMPQGGSTETARDTLEFRSDTIAFIESLISVIAEREDVSADDVASAFKSRP